MLDEILAEAVADAGSPGAAAGLLVDGEVTTAGVGVTSVEAPAPVDERTLFQVASITKTVAAFGVAVLAEEGRVALDDPVARHLPDVARDARLPEELTVEHCLSHRVGIEGDHLFFGGGDLASLAGAERFFAPGERYSYCNAGFSLAAAIVERLTAVPFERFLRERVLKPLGMRTSCFTADRAIFERVALPHWVLPGTEPALLRRAGWQPGWELAAVDHAAAGMATSAVELLRWAACVLDGGAGLVAPEAVARLLEPVVDGDGDHRIALDWESWDVDGVRLHAHGGLTAGYCSVLVVIPARRAALCCMVNATNGATVHRDVRRRVLEDVLGIGDPDPSPLAAQPDAGRYVGDYRHSNGVLHVRAAAPGAGGPLVVAMDPHPPGTLAWQPPPSPPATVAFCAPDTVVVVGDHPGAGGTATFAPDASWLRWNGRLAPRATT